MKHLTPPSQPLLTNLLSHIQPIPLDSADAERAYLARQLVLCTLPHSDPGPVDCWTRSSSNLKLVITRTQLDSTGRLIGYPFGSIPRLILFWLNTEAVKTGNRRIELGHTLSDFMRQLGLDPRNGTGPRGDSTRLKNQMGRLFASSITFQQSPSSSSPSSSPGPSHRFLNMQIASEGELWWNPHNPSQGQLWGSWILLGDRFFSAITSAPVPVDLRILREIKHSPLALDLYAWLTYTAFRAHRTNSVLTTTWPELALQLGSEYASPKEFGRNSRQALQRIQALYSGARVRMVSGGLQISPESEPSVQPVKGRGRGSRGR